MIVLLHGPARRNPWWELAHQTAFVFWRHEAIGRSGRALDRILTYLDRFQAHHFIRAVFQVKEDSAQVLGEANERYPKTRLGCENCA